MRGLIGPYILSDDSVLHPTGQRSAVLRTGEIDIDALDPVRRAAVLAAFTRLCHTLDTPLQLLVRIRRLEPAVPAREAQKLDVLEQAMREHGERRLRGATVHRRTVYVAARAASAAGLDATLQRVGETLHAMGVPAQRVRGSDLAQLLHGAAATEQEWSSSPRFARVQDELLCGQALRRLPAHHVAAGWLQPLLDVEADCDIAIQLAPASLSDALRTLGRRLRDFSAHRLIEAERGALADVHVDIAVDAAMSLRGRLARNAGRPLHLSLVVLVRARREDELREPTQRVRLAFRAALAEAEPTHFRHLAAHLTALPLALDALGVHKLVESAAAATCVPWSSSSCDEPDGYRIGEARGSRRPVAVAPFDRELHRNANIAILAASGHGKSFTVGTLVLEAALHGVQSIVIDPEGEYRRLVDALGGAYLTLAPGTDTALNVFDAVGGGDGDAVAAVTELVDVLCGGRLDEVARAHVDTAAHAALRTAAAQRRVPLLEDTLPALARQQPGIALVVQRHCRGALGQLFNRPTTARLDRDVNAVSLRDLPPEQVAAATLILARCLWRLVQRDPRRRHIVFDEVGALCTHAPLRHLLVQLARRCRKYGASLVVATQNAQDLLGSDEGTVVATNCAVVLLGGHRAAETARLESAFGLTAGQRRFLDTAGRGEFLLLAGDRRLEVRIDVPHAWADLLPAPAAGAGAG